MYVFGGSAMKTFFSTFSIHPQYKTPSNPSISRHIHNYIETHGHRSHLELIFPKHPQRNFTISMDESISFKKNKIIIKSIADIQRLMKKKKEKKRFPMCLCAFYCSLQWI